MCQSPCWHLEDCTSLPTTNLQPWAQSCAFWLNRGLSFPSVRVGLTCGLLHGFTQSSPVLIVLHHLVTSSAFITVKWTFLPGEKRRARADAYQPSSCHQVSFTTFSLRDLIMEFAWYVCSSSHFVVLWKHLVLVFFMWQCLEVSQFCIQVVGTIGTSSSIVVISRQHSALNYCESGWMLWIVIWLVYPHFWYSWLV